MYAHYDEEVIEHIKQRSFEIMEREEVELRIVELRKQCRELAKKKNFPVNVP